MPLECVYSKEKAKSCGCFGGVDEVRSDRYWYSRLAGRNKSRGEELLPEHEMDIASLRLTMAFAMMLPAAARDRHSETEKYLQGAKTSE